MLKPHNKKIAILLPDLRGGGAERVAVNLANEISEKGFSVDLVLLNNVGVFMPEVCQRVNIINLNSSRIRSSIRPLVNYINEHKPDAMIANMWPLSGIAGLAKWLSGNRFVLAAVEHTNWQCATNRYGWFQKLFMRISMRLLYPLSNHIIVVSEGASSALSKISAIKIELISTIYNPIVGNTENNSVDGLNVESWLRGSGRKIISIGTLKPEKNFTLLLHAFSLVLKEQDATLLILGEGENRIGLQELVSEYGLQDLVLMPGFSTNPQQHLREADLFVLPSNHEGFGNVIVEALHAGVPVVSTDCPSGPREILENGKYGILVPVGDAEALAEAMLKSISSSHDKEALKERAQDFTIAKAADEYLTLLFPEKQSRSYRG